MDKFDELFLKLDQASVHVDKRRDGYRHLLRDVMLALLITAIMAVLVFLALS